AAAILHDDGYAQGLRERLSHRTGDDVRRASRRERHDEVDRLLGPVRLREEGERDGCEGGSEQPGELHRAISSGAKGIATGAGTEPRRAPILLRSAAPRNEGD